MSTRFCVQCCAKRASHSPSPCRCGDCDALPREKHFVRFDGDTGDRLNPPAMPGRSLLGGIDAPQIHDGRFAFAVRS